MRTTTQTAVMDHALKVDGSGCVGLLFANKMSLPYQVVVVLY
jgi:hypothetical protein